MEKEKNSGPPSLSVIKWIMSRPEGKQFLTACLVVISFETVTIARQEYRFEANLEKWNKREIELQGEVKTAKQETIEFLKSANADAQKMRDSLYSIGMRQKEIEKQVIKNSK